MAKDLSTLDWQPSDDDMAAYKATDAKGRGYSLVRNRKRSELMFVIADGLNVPPGWYTDKDGAIRKIS